MRARLHKVLRDITDRLKTERDLLAAQEELVREACRSAGIEPNKVQFVEAHGPGTLVGDPIEARALGAVLGRKRISASSASRTERSPRLSVCVTE